MPTPTGHHIKWKKTIARTCFFACFVLATITLLFRQQMEIITSRRALDRLVRMLGCYLTITIISITHVPRHFFRLSILLISIILLGISMIQPGASPRHILLVAGMAISVLILYSTHKRRLRTRAQRSSRRYLVFGAPGFLGISAAILSIAFISSFSTAKLDCSLLQNNLRRSAIEQKFTQTSLGEMLGLNNEQLKQLDENSEQLS
ncbi:MAG: hypothetical protein Q8O99_01850 [bacterium]|nr:hypothetical protein [bacterium]